MPTVPDAITVFIALALAVAAAITSLPLHAIATWQVSEWMQLSICPEADAMAGAIGEHPETMPAP